MLDAVLFSIGVGMVAAVAASHRRLAATLHAGDPPPPLDHHPSLTVIRPIKGLDPGVEENLRAGLDHGYPGDVETLFVFDDRDEPALPIVERVVAEWRAAGSDEAIEILFCGPPPPGRTGKLNAMIHGLARARGECVAFVDSDVRADRDALRVAVETLAADPKAGSAAAPVVVSPPHEGLADAASAVLLNGLYCAPSRLAAARSGRDLPFILGQLMVLRREALLAIANLEDVAGNFVDDIQIGALMHRAGFRNLVTTHPVDMIWQGASFGEFVRNFVRWMSFSRGFPTWSFVAPVFGWAVIYFAGLIGAAAFAASGAAAVAVAWFAGAAAVNASLVRLQAAIGGAPLRPRHWLAPTVVLCLVPFVFARVYTQRSVSWRGRRYDLGSDGRLADLH